jgi:hypothetical protein
MSPVAGFLLNKKDKKRTQLVIPPRDKPEAERKQIFQKTDSRESEKETNFLETESREQ